MTLGEIGKLGITLGSMELNGGSIMGQAVFVTGATGNVGLELVNILSRQGYEVVAGVRNVNQSREILPANIECREFDFNDFATFEASLKGVKKMFLVRPPSISQVKKYIFPLIDVAQSTGVKHVVFLSLLGAEKNRVVPHHKIEKYILNSHLSYTFLRASFFMQNLNTTHQDEIKKDNEIFVPAGKGKTSFIDVRDIAEIGAKVLTETGHENKAYDLTGNEALDYYQVAEIFTKVLGRKITYINPSILKFYRRMRVKGYPLAFIIVMIGIYSTAKFGLAKKVEDDVKKLLKREPIRMERYIEDFRKYWE